MIDPARFKVGQVLKIPRLPETIAPHPAPPAPVGSTNEIDAILAQLKTHDDQIEQALKDYLPTSSHVDKLRQAKDDYLKQVEPRLLAVYDQRKATHEQLKKEMRSGAKPLQDAERLFAVVADAAKPLIERRNALVHREGEINRVLASLDEHEKNVVTSGSDQLAKELVSQARAFSKQGKELLKQSSSSEALQALKKADGLYDEAVDLAMTRGQARLFAGEWTPKKYDDPDYSQRTNGKLKIRIGSDSKIYISGSCGYTRTLGMMGGLWPDKWSINFQEQAFEFPGVKPGSNTISIKGRVKYTRDGDTREYTEVDLEFSLDDEGQPTLMIEFRSDAHLLIKK